MTAKDFIAKYYVAAPGKRYPLVSMWIRYRQVGEQAMVFFVDALGDVGCDIDDTGSVVGIAEKPPIIPRVTYIGEGQYSVKVKGFSVLVCFRDHCSDTTELARLARMVSAAPAMYDILAKHRVNDDICELLDAIDKGDDA